MIRDLRAPGYEQMRYDVRRAFASIEAIEIPRGSKLSLQEIADMKILPRGCWELIGGWALKLPRVAWRRRGGGAGRGRPWSAQHRLVKDRQETRCGLPLPDRRDFEIVYDEPSARPCGLCEGRYGTKAPEPVAAQGGGELPCGTSA